MRGTVGHVDLNRLNGEGNGAVFREHGSDHVDDNVQLGLVRSGRVDEDVLGLAGDDLGVCRDISEVPL